MGCDREILLLSEPTSASRFEEFKQVLSKRNGIVDRTGNLHYVNLYSEPEYFFAKCFPTLFPYGRGCPSDKNTEVKSIAAHAKYCLMRGGNPDGRRCQMNPSYVFLMYTLEVRRRIGGVTYKAAKPYKDDVEAAKAVPTVQDMSDVVEYMNKTDVCTMQACVDEYVPPENVVVEEKKSLKEDVGRMMAKMMSELMPYSQSLKGSAMYIMRERTKLMAMLTSPVITTEGTWRWFVTHAPADLYDPLLYDIAIDESMDARLPGGNMLNTFAYKDRIEVGRS